MSPNRAIVAIIMVLPLGCFVGVSLAKWALTKKRSDK